MLFTPNKSGLLWYNIRLTSHELGQMILHFELNTYMQLTWLSWHMLSGSHFHSPPFSKHTILLYLFTISLLCDQVFLKPLLFLLSLTVQTEGKVTLSTGLPYLSYSLKQSNLSLHLFLSFPFPFTHKIPSFYAAFSVLPMKDTVKMNWILIPKSWKNLKCRL